MPQGSRKGSVEEVRMKSEKEQGLMTNHDTTESCKREDREKCGQNMYKHSQRQKENHQLRVVHTGEGKQS